MLILSFKQFNTSMAMENIDWKNLPFAYQKTDYNVRSYFRDGKWTALEETTSEVINLHMSATALHYGQEAFEGLKAYRGADNKIRLFRVEENARRMIRSARGVMMAEVPEELFIEAVIRAVKLNEKYVPPYGTGAALYVRPLLIGSGPEIGVKPAMEYLFMIFVTPVGPYFKDGFKPVSLMISRDYDRAAPLGTGSYKVGGNYAASLNSLKDAQKAGYSTALYLDAREKKYIDEAGPANFFAIKDKTYITPDSASILPSITNMSLQTLAEDMGLKVEKRKVAFEELSSFEEVGACGTAAVIAPVGLIYDPEHNITYTYTQDGEPGKTCTELYKRLVDIQYGDRDDKFGWITFVD
jgi:branched-chain amino acid aminotransferase